LKSIWDTFAFLTYGSDKITNKLRDIVMSSQLVDEFNLVHDDLLKIPGVEEASSKKEEDATEDASSFIEIPVKHNAHKMRMKSDHKNRWDLEI